MSVGAYGALNGYWGQYGAAGLERLSHHCDSGIEMVTLGFVNKSPENDPSGYPGTNFAAHCWATTYKNEDNVSSSLLDNCRTIQEDIPYCQDRGVKVLLSIGGQYNDEENNYSVSSKSAGVEFAEFLYKAFGPYDESWDGPRPFDSVADGTHPAVDGFDFDIEAELDNKGYIAMVETFRELDSSLFISAAPQCPTGDDFFYLRDLIQEAEFDALFVQFYNNEQCEYYTGVQGGLNYGEWISVISESSKSQNAKLFLGLPGSEEAAGSGYIKPKDITNLICAAKDLPSFGGISLWDLTRGAANQVTRNKSYVDLVQDLLLGIGCPKETTSSTRTASATDTATSIVTPPTGTPTPITPSETETPGPSTTTSSKGGMTTSTVVTTQTQTLPCPTKCPGGVYTTTKVIPLYTTVCPVGWKPTGTQSHAKPTGGAGEVPHGGKPEDEKPHGGNERPEGGDDKPHGEKPHSGGNTPEGEKPHGGEEIPESEKPHGGDEVPEGEKPHGGSDKPEDEQPHGDEPNYEQTTTLIVVPSPTGGVATPTPEAPSETPKTAGASNLAAGVSGLLALAALQVLVL